MIDSPLIRELMAEKVHHAILRALRVRFREIPLAVEELVRKVKKEERLDELFDYAVVCRDVEAFRERLLS